MKSKGIVCYKGGNWKVSCLRQKVPLGIEPRISCLWVRFFNSLSHRDAWLLFSFNWFASKLEILCYVILKVEVLRCICGLCVSWTQCRDWTLGPTHLICIHTVPFLHHGHRQNRHLLCAPWFSFAKWKKQYLPLGKHSSDK